MKLKNEFERIYADDEGIKQQQFKILEEIDQRLKTGIDWGRIKDIEESLM